MAFTSQPSQCVLIVFSNPRFCRQAVLVAFLSASAFVGATAAWNTVAGSVVQQTGVCCLIVSHEHACLTFAGVSKSGAGGEH